MKWYEFKNKIDEIMIGHENEDIFSIIVFLRKDNKFELIKENDILGIRNERKIGIIK